MIDIIAGTRVKVLPHWNWPTECTGVITAPPEYAQRLVADEEGWRGLHRTVQGRKGPIIFVWVTFDTPQNDGDGDGPYSGGEVETRYVVRVEA